MRNRIAVKVAARVSSATAVLVVRSKRPSNLQNWTVQATVRSATQQWAPSRSADPLPRGDADLDPSPVQVSAAALVVVALVRMQFCWASARPVGPRCLEGRCGSRDDNYTPRSALFRRSPGGQQESNRPERALL